MNGIYVGDSFVSFGWLLDTNTNLQCIRFSVYWVYLGYAVRKSSYSSKSSVSINWYRARFAIGCSFSFSITSSVHMIIFSSFTILYKKGIVYSRIENPYSTCALALYKSKWEKSNLFKRHTEITQRMDKLEYIDILNCMRSYSQYFRFLHSVRAVYTYATPHLRRLPNTRQPLNECESHLLCTFLVINFFSLLFIRWALHSCIHSVQLSSKKARTINVISITK